LTSKYIAPKSPFTISMKTLYITLLASIMAFVVQAQSSGDLIPGCTNFQACNFDPLAEVDDGSCVYDIHPAFYLTTWNAYELDCESPSTPVDPSTPLLGTMDIMPGGMALADETEPAEWEGCGNTISILIEGTEVGTVEYFGGYAILSQFGDCVQLWPAQGCTDADADNYNPYASDEDGSCLYENDCEVPVTDPGTQQEGFNGAYDAANWSVVANGNGAVTFYEDDELHIIGSNEDIELMPMLAGEILPTLTQATIIADQTGTYTFKFLYYTFDGPEFDVAYYINGEPVVLVEGFPLLGGGGGGAFTETGEISFDATAGDEIGFGIDATDNCCGEGVLIIYDFLHPADECVPGCTDETACNYNPEATFDDGFCLFPGCMSPVAANFDPEADCPGECDFSNVGCEDETAVNYDPEATEIVDCLFENFCGAIETEPGTHGGFTGSYIPENWEFSTVSEGSFAFDEDGEVLLINGSDIQDIEFLGGGSTETQVTITVAEGGTFTFDWNYYTIDGTEFDIAYYINDTRIDLFDPIGPLLVSGGGGGVFLNGSVTFDANAGDIIGFGVDSTDDCCGAGTLTITNFTHPGQVCIPGCTDEDACNYDETATEDDDSCDYSCYGCTDETACNYDPEATIDDDNCLFPGCMIPLAINFDPEASCPDFCDFSNLGCQDETADNYNAEAVDPLNCANENDCGVLTTEPGVGAGFHGDYDPGNWMFTTESDGSVDVDPTQEILTVYGGNGENWDEEDELITETQLTIEVTSSGIFSFDWFYATLDGPEYDIAYYINGERIDLFDEGFDGPLLVGGGGPFTLEGSETFEAQAGDIIGFGVDSTDDCCGLGSLTITNFTWPEVCALGCTDPEACNFDAEASDEDGSCEYAEEFFDCDGNCLNDADEDGICDELEIAGCTDEEACNYNEEATDDDGSCSYISAFDIEGPTQVITTDTETYTYEETAGSTYEWTVEGGTIVSGQGTATIEVEWVTDPGSVSVVETNEAGCVGDEVSIDVEVGPISVEEYTSLDWSVYPNPSNGLLTVRIDEVGFYEVTVTDATGRIVHATSINGTTVVDLSALAAGTYQLHLTADDAMFTKRIAIFRN
jgi:hypothetical protein